MSPVRHEKIFLLGMQNILIRQGHLNLTHQPTRVLLPDIPPSIAKGVALFHETLTDGLFREDLGLPAHFFCSSSSLNSLYSTASTSASHDASMMFSLTPTVPHTLPASRHSTTTRTRAA